MKAIREVRVSLRPRITCPHCWEVFAPEQTLWVASSPDLVDDTRLGEGHPKRFLPTRFNEDGNALDLRGYACQELACPRCHLGIPRGLLEIAPVFMSIAGTPQCGKSYFLAAMTWTLRQALPRDFQLSYTDADPKANALLNEYEELQFLNPKQDEIVKIKKTEEQGDAYDEVTYGEQRVSYPRPLLFTIRPTKSHPSFAEAQRVSRLLCLYDNAGESFLPGRDTVVNPVTRHLSRSNAVLYCFDPTQDLRFRRECCAQSTDFQIQQGPVTARQEIVLHEIISRIRHHTGLRQTESRKQPLIVVVTKYDAWWNLLGQQRFETPVVPSTIPGIQSLDTRPILEVSHATRNLLARFSPELVAAAEEFSERVWFIPVSATGCSPEYGGEVDGRSWWGVRPRNICPMWCEIPLMVALAGVSGGLIPIRRHDSEEEPVADLP